MDASLLTDPTILLAIALIALAVLILSLGPFPWAYRPRPTQQQPRQDDAVLIQPAAPVTIGPSADSLAAQPRGERRGVLEAAAAILIGPAPAVTIRPTPATTITPPKRGAWDEKGWHERQERGLRVYTGFYRVLHRQSGQFREYAGRVHVQGRQVTPWIADPPAELARHPKAPCFRIDDRLPWTREAGITWFRAHWYKPAENVDEGILSVERVLDEALNGRR